MSTELVMPSNHLILCHPLLLLPSIFPSIRVFSSESTLCIRWPLANEFFRSVLPKNIQGWFPLGFTGLISLPVQGTLKSVLQHHNLKTSSFLHEGYFSCMSILHPFCSCCSQTMPGRLPPPCGDMGALPILAPVIGCTLCLNCLLPKLHLFLTHWNSFSSNLLMKDPSIWLVFPELIHVFKGCVHSLYPWRNSLSSVQFSRSVVSNSLRPHELQHARPPCSSPTPRVHSNSCPSSQWCHPAISSSVVPFSSCPQSLPASESFPVSQLFAWGGQSTGVSASASFLPKNTRDWFPLEWTGWISLQSSLDGCKHFSAHTSLFLSVSCKCGPLCLQALNLASKKYVTSLTFFVANIFK